MASRYRDERLIDKVDELAASLHATTEVLSTADHMLDHYRDLNKDQDVEIARLNGELHAAKRPVLERRRRGRSLSRGSSVSDTEGMRQRSSRVRFTDDDSASEVEELESALKDLSRKQNRLEKELQRNRRKGSEELRSLADSLRKDTDDAILDNRLRELQQQLELDKMKKLQRHDSVEKLADEIRQIKGLVQSRGTREPLAPRSDLSNSRSYIEELQHERERASRDQETISDLRRQLRQREDGQERLMSQLRKTTAELEESDANQLRIAKRLESLEEKFDREKREKQNLENELGSFKDQATKATRANAEITSQLQYLRSQSNRTEPQISDLHRKLDNLEREKEKANDKLNSCKIESDRKDTLIDRMTSQIRDLTAHVEKAESDKRKYYEELENAMKNMRDYARNLDNAKTLLREKEDDLKDSEEKRQDLKNRALEAIKDYRNKLRELEKENAKIQEREELQEQELSRMRSEKREQEFEVKKSERDVKETESRVKELENDIKRQQNQISQLAYEKAQLEEGLSISNETKKDTMKLQRELQELSARNAAVSGQLTEETAKRRELEERLEETREKESATKDENSNLYQQLQEERSSHAAAMRRMEEELRAVSANEDRTFKDIMDKSNAEKAKYEDEIRSLNTQLIEERSLVKANQLSKQDQEDEIDKLNAENNRLIEENRRIRKKYQLMKKEYEGKLSNLEKESYQHRDRIRELEDELRNNQENLLQTREAFKQSLRDVHSLVDTLLDGLMQETEQTMPIKSLSESVPLDPKKWSMDILDKLRKCCALLSPITERNSKQRSQLAKAQEKLKGLLKEGDEDKNYFLGELEKQNDLIETFKKEKREWERAKVEKDRNIKNLEERLSEVTKHLEQCTKVLHGTLNAMEEKTTVLAELDSLKSEHLENERLNENYIRHKERLDNLQDQLQDAKATLQGLKDDNVDTTTFNMKLIKSLSPAPKRRYESKVNSISRRHQERHLDHDPFQDLSRLVASSDIQDERPSPPKKSKDVTATLMADL